MPPHAPFRAARLDIGSFVNKWVIRDHTKRKVFAEYEADRQALRYVVRNLSLPQATRAKAQLQLAQMHAYTRRVQIKNRCLATGRGKAVLRDFRLCRFQFRLKALEGLLPGVRKASW